MANLALDVIRNSCLELTINGAMPSSDDRQRRILDNHHVLSFYDSEHAPLRGPDRFSWFAGRLKLLKHLLDDPDISHLFNAKLVSAFIESSHSINVRRAVLRREKKTFFFADMCISGSILGKAAALILLARK